MDEAPAKLLILGDSHAVALKAGCDAIGLPAELLSFSGNFWHRGHIVLNRRKGIWAKGQALQDRITRAQGRLGAPNLLRSGLPILASFGFHLGRIVPAFRFQGHTVDAAEFRAAPQHHFATAALTEAYVGQYRDGHVQMLARIARVVPVVAVCPPRISDDPVQLAFLGVLKQKITAAGVSLFDPCQALFAPSGLLPDAMRADERGHGTADYGALVVRSLLDRGLLQPAP